MKFHYIQPYDSTSPPNIGGAINRAIRDLITNEDDFICLTDHDTMWLLPDSKRQLQSILETTDYDLLGPVTNRLAAPYQLVSGMFDNFDIQEHTRVARKLQQQNTNTIIPTTTTLAAFCLCFKVDTWRKLGGFHQNTIQFDTLFSMDARKAGMKLGIMTGVYIFHAYRLLSDNPCTDIKHLV